MNSLEPNVTALSWFVVLWSVCCLGFLQLAGAYPFRIRDRGRTSALLVLGNTALWLLLLAGTLAFAIMQLRWTTSVVVGGILFLFMPEPFQAIPDRWRDSHAGMAVALCVLGAALGILTLLPGSPLG